VEREHPSRLAHPLHTTKSAAPAINHPTGVDQRASSTLAIAEEAEWRLDWLRLVIAQFSGSRLAWERLERIQIPLSTCPFIKTTL
jgi:hypothetical protein